MVIAELKIAQETRQGLWDSKGMMLWPKKLRRLLLSFHNELLQITLIEMF